MSMVGVGGSSGGKQGRCLAINEVSISLTPSVVTTKVLSKLHLFGKISRPAGSNTFRFIFENGSATKRVLERGRWCIKGDMLVLLSWSSGFGVKEFSFNSIRFWVQIHFLPHDYFSRTNANVLGALAGKVVFIDLDEAKPLTWKNWIRVQLNTRSKYASCFSGKEGKLVVNGGDLLREKGSVEEAVGRELVLVNRSPMVPASEKMATAPPVATPVSHAKASRSVRGRSLRGRGGGQVRTVWLPKRAGVEKGHFSTMGDISLSSNLDIQKETDHFPSKGCNLNCLGDEGNRVISLTGLGGQLAMGICETLHGFDISDVHESSSGTRVGVLGPRNGLATIKAHVDLDNIDIVGGTKPSDKMRTNGPNSNLGLTNFIGPMHGTSGHVYGAGPSIKEATYMGERGYITGSKALHHSRGKAVATFGQSFADEGGSMMSILGQDQYDILMRGGPSLNSFKYKKAIFKN
ncbi:hypothetical protein F8388_010731 [Cannabis sativa]|uniref:DUF4283 domain-containing protein n=1 Tax=Cannabis sativa TaxID=3483 RepID=A0A7J6DKL9_CANSA|nr:hypothetical protein G4B88_030232 [Cannabis sativa]KAF4378292.1 hypothetical protein F8388_010731 [Cannabis sativa]